MTNESDELPRLRAQVYALQARLDRRQRRAATVMMLRRVVATVLIAVTALALVTSVVGIWSARTALNTRVPPGSPAHRPASVLAC